MLLIHNNKKILDLRGRSGRHQRIQLEHDAGQAAGGRKVFLAGVVRKRTVSHDLRHFFIRPYQVTYKYFINVFGAYKQTVPSEWSAQI